MSRTPRLIATAGLLGVTSPTLLEIATSGLIGGAFILNGIGIWSAPISSRSSVDRGMRAILPIFPARTAV
jgi:hypothetical protein